MLTQHLSVEPVSRLQALLFVFEVVVGGAWPDSAQLPIGGQLGPQVCVFFRRLRLCDFDLKGQYICLPSPPMGWQEVELGDSAASDSAQFHSGEEKVPQLLFTVVIGHSTSRNEKFCGSLCQLVALRLPLEVCVVAQPAWCLQWKS